MYIYIYIYRAFLGARHTASKRLPTDEQPTPPALLGCALDRHLHHSGRGNNLSNAACLSQVFFKHCKYCCNVL